MLTTFRLAAYETPLWATPNIVAGRYNDAGDGCTQYLSLHPMTPWAELLRKEDRQTRSRALQLRFPLWAIKVDLENEPLELTFDTARDWGLSPEDLVSDDHRPCRELAQALRTDPAAPHALLAPSAALPGTRNLVLLEPYVKASFELTPVAPEDLPVAMAAQDGRCPEQLWDFVHYRGAATTHPALSAWQDDEPYVFDEPPVVPESLVA